LGDSLGSVREAAAWALKELGALTTELKIKKYIIDLGDNEYVQKAAEALVGIGKPAVEPLIKALGDSDWKVREASAEALGRIGDKRAVEPLIKALGDSLGSVREAAAEALGRIGDKRAVEPLIKALGDSLGFVREASAEALGRIGDKRAVEPLIKALGDSERYVREAAAEALDKLGWEPGEDENGVWYWIAKLDWKKCVALGPIAVEPLIKALGHSDWKVREAAAKALGRIGDKRAVEPLIKALSDGGWDVRRAAAEALVTLYHSGVLSSDLKNRILAHRSRIIEEHYDQEASCGHSDRGIGVDFPL
jgi:HEAT repeat protein